MDKLRRALSGDESIESGNSDEATGFASQFRDGTSMGWTSRIKGFAICFGLGFVLSVLGTMFLAIPVKGLRLFAIFYSFGNVMSIVSTSFLVGPAKQLKSMFNPTRLIPAIVALSFLILTLFSALYLKKTGLTIICCIIQFLAFTWYCLSYIPFARDAVRKILQI